MWSQPTSRGVLRIIACFILMVRAPSPRLSISLLFVLWYAAAYVCEVDGSMSRALSKDGSGVLRQCGDGDYNDAPAQLMEKCAGCIRPHPDATCPGGCCGQSLLFRGGNESSRLSPSNNQFVVCLVGVRCMRVLGSAVPGSVVILQTSIVPHQAGGGACIGTFKDDPKLSKSTECAVSFNNKSLRNSCPNGIRIPATSVAFIPSGTCASDGIGNKSDTQLSTTSASDKGPNGGVIAGAIVAALVVLCMTVAIIWFFCRKKQTTNDEVGAKGAHSHPHARLSHRGVLSSSVAPAVPSSTPLAAAAAPDPFLGEGSNEAPPSYAAGARRSRRIASLFANSRHEPVSANQQDAASWSPQPDSTRTLRLARAQERQEAVAIRDPPLPMVRATNFSSNTGGFTPPVSRVPTSSQEHLHDMS
jgi:hypothetical protein